MHDTYPCELSLNRFKRVRRATTTASKSLSKRELKTFKHGLEVPRNWKDIVRIDAEAGNRRWQDAVEQEVDALIMHGCFDFKTPNYNLPTD